MGEDSLRSGHPNLRYVEITLTFEHVSNKGARGEDVLAYY